MTTNESPHDFRSTDLIRVTPSEKPRINLIHTRHRLSWTGVQLDRQDDQGDELLQPKWTLSPLAIQLFRRLILVEGIDWVGFGYYTVIISRGELFDWEADRLYEQIFTIFEEVLMADDLIIEVLQTPPDDEEADAPDDEDDPSDDAPDAPEGGAQ